MSKDKLMLLFTAGIFLMTLLTFILCKSSSNKIKILTIIFSITYRKNSSPVRNLKATIFITKDSSDTSCLLELYISRVPKRITSMFSTLFFLLSAFLVYIISNFYKK